jgi:hypothetical protein
MKRRFRDYLWNLVVIAPIAAAGGPAYAAALSPQQQACIGIGGTLQGTTCKVGGAGGGVLSNVFKSAANTLIFVVLAISTIMVIIGGLRYVLSGGDSSGIKSAKDTILYSLVGIGVAITAYAIVNFVVNAIR